MAVRVDRPAWHGRQALPRGNHYALTTTCVGSRRRAPVDISSDFCRAPIGFGIRIGYEDGKYDDPASHIFGPSGPTAWLLRKRQTYRFAYDNGAR